MQFDEVLQIANDPDFSESGGGHNQKGTEFQKHWAVMQMFALTEEGQEDFLFLFEAVQDISILDSSTKPTAICIYQVKKKERKEWAWNDLTSLDKPLEPGKKTKRKLKSVEEIKGSTLGKLYEVINAFETLQATGRFISNAGCDLPLEKGGNAATSLPCPLSDLSNVYRNLLTQGFQTLLKAGSPPADLSKIYIERVNLSINEPGKHLVGYVHDYLLKKSPTHAGQARSLVDSLMAKIGPLGAKTDKCKDFDQMQKQHGYTKSEFIEAMGALEALPDLLAHLETWLDFLSKEGMGLMELTSIRAAAASLYRRQVIGAKSKDEESLVTECDVWLAKQPDPKNVTSFINKAYKDFGHKYTNIKKTAFSATLILRAIEKCVDQT